MGEKETASSLPGERRIEEAHERAGPDAARAANLNPSKSNIEHAVAIGHDYEAEAETSDEPGSSERAVKSGKSNSSDRLAGEGGASPEAQESTTVKSSKSNTQDRLAVGGSDAGPDARDATTVKGSKSNSSE